MTESAAPRSAAAYDGLDAATLSARLGVPRVVVLDATPSTLDIAHLVAEAGAPDGTLVLADRQTAGRGRQGRRWDSPAGVGIWLTLVERAVPVDAVSVLSIRLGLHAAPVLDAFAREPVRLKWPNDLYVEDGKLAGVLCEARWQGDQVAWVAVGMGLNVGSPGREGAAWLRPGTTRLAVLERLVPALRAAAAREGPLDEGELAAYAARDLGRGRRCQSPVPGTVGGIAPDGALLVDTAGGRQTVHGGSLIFAEDAS